MRDDDFEPFLGRMRSLGRKGSRKYLHQVLAATNLARGGVATGSKRGTFHGSRIGRGGVVGRVLAGRDRFAAFRDRRVIIKSRIVKLSGNGLGAARAHLRYVQRDGTSRDGKPGSLYGRDVDGIDGKAFLKRADGDRHQFRFIVSPEDGDQYEELKPLTRRLMAQMEEDLGTRLDWVAVDHFNTGHPHTHIILRGKVDRGQDLIIARDYMARGMRERAAEIVGLDLGPRGDREIEPRLRAEIDQEWFTGIDRRLMRNLDENGMILAQASDPFEQSLRAGRLRKLAQLGLAQEITPGRWHLGPDLEPTLRRMGERGDIIKTMHRELAARGVTRAMADQSIFDPTAPDAPDLVGRVLSRGLSDEMRDRHYLIVDGIDGRAHHVDIGLGDRTAQLPEDAIVRITPHAVVGPRAVDLTVLEVAIGNGGRYDVDAHLTHDRTASETFAQAHVRRLEAMRRETGYPERLADGTWVIGKDHLQRAAAFETARARQQPVAVEILSALPLERLPNHDGPTWLDRELLSDAPAPLRDAGFGRQVRQAQAVRVQWLIDEQLARSEEGNLTYRRGAIDLLRGRERSRMATKLSAAHDLRFVEVQPGERVEGLVRRIVDAGSGRYAMIESAKEFNLVPWTPILERQLGKPVSGIMREQGISLTIGRSRQGPEVS
jgi:type IV secretory pathway VirD2 relaxase